MRHRLALIAVLFALAALLGAGPATAQAWPSRSVSIVVPFPPGGATDVIARLLAEHFRKQFGQPFVIDNKPGATGNIGAGAVARAVPDGYTLLVSTSGPIATNVLIFKKLPFDTRKDFTPIAPLAEIPALVVANPNVPVKTIQDLIAYDRANPGKLNLGHAGIGGMGHMAAELLAMTAQTKFVTVAYQGSAPATTALLSGETDFGVDLASSYLPHIQAGKIRALAVTTAKRLPQLPDVPTVAEQGVPGFEAAGFAGLEGPVGLSPEIVKKLNAAANDWLATDEAKATLAKNSLTPIPGTPEDLHARVLKEIDKWRPVVERAGIALD